jgi:hypothetical protein
MASVGLLRRGDEVKTGIKSRYKITIRRRHKMPPDSVKKGLLSRTVD